MQENKQNNKPRGIIILAVLIIIFGALSLINYFSFDYSRYQESLKKIGQEKIQAQISEKQANAVSNISLVISVILLASGLGLLYQKEVARKTIVYFSSVIIVLFILAAIFQPSSVMFAFPQFLFFSIAVLYFTKNNIKKYFFKKTGEEEK